MTALCTVPALLQGSGIEDPTTFEDQLQTAAAASLKLPWLGFILGHVLVPNQGSLTGKFPGTAAACCLGLQVQYKRG